MAKDTVFVYCVEYPLRDYVYIGSTINPIERKQYHGHRGTLFFSDSEYYKEIKMSGLKINFYVIDSCHRSERPYWERFYIDLYKTWGFKIKNKYNPCYHYLDKQYNNEKK